MFTSDKDLRKVAPKKTGKSVSSQQVNKSSGSSVINPGIEGAASISLNPTRVAENIVDHAKKERELRQQKRQQVIYVTLVQSWWRGRHSANLFRRNLFMSIVKKLADVENLARLLNSKGITFIPPLDSTISLLREVNYFWRHGQRFILIESLLLPFSRLVLLPVTSSPDKTKNLLALCARDERLSTDLQRFMLELVGNLSSLPETLPSDASKLMLLTLRTIVLPSSASDALDQDPLIQQWRQRFVSQDLFKQARLVFTRHSSYRRNLKITSWEEFYEQYSSLQYHSYSAEEFFVQMKSLLFRGKEGEIHAFVFDSVFSLLVDVTRHCKSERLPWFIEHVLTIPLLTCMVSNKKIQSKLFAISSDKSDESLILISDIMQYLYSPASSNSSFTRIEAFMYEIGEDYVVLKSMVQLRRGYFILGNLLSCTPLIFKCMDLTHLSSRIKTLKFTSSAWEVAGDRALTMVGKVLELMDFLFFHFPLPGILQGNAGVIWHRSGTAHTAVGIPFLFTVQILQIYDITALRCLFLLLFPNYSDGQDRALNWDLFAIAKELKEIETASTTNSSYTMIQQQLEDSKASTAPLWLQPSKWAAKLGLNNLVAQFTSTTSATTASSSSASAVDKNSSWFSSLFGGGNKPANAVPTAISPSSQHSSKEAAKIEVLEVLLPPVMVNRLVNTLLMLVINGNLSKMDSIPWRATSYLTFSLPTIPSLWFLLQQQHIKSNNRTNNVLRFALSFQPEAHYFILDDATFYSATSLGGGNRKKISSIKARFPLPFSLAYLLASLLRLYLVALDDVEFYDQQKPIPLHQIISIVPMLNHFLYEILKVEPFVLHDQSQSRREQFLNSLSESNLKPNPTSTTSQPSGQAIGSLLSLQEHQDYITDLYSIIARNIQTVLTDFYTRWARRPFYAPQPLWSIPDTQTSAFKHSLLAPGSSSKEAGKESFSHIVLRQMPWAIPLTERLQYLRQELDRQRVSIQGTNDTSFLSFLGLGQDPPGFRSKGTIVTIHRERLLADSMQQLTKLTSAQWKDRLVIRYIDSFGNEEKGIDIGGLFKDYVTDLTTNIIFNTSYGLFVPTGDHLLYPNPYSHIVLSSSSHEVEETYRFLGRVLGKAIFENITISPQFTYFFLSFMNGRYNFMMNLLSDLRTLDPELYKNLMFLKSYDGDVNDLALTFSITDTSFGLNQEVPLIPNGSNIDVTSSNRLRYIHLVAKYYLHDRLRRQAGAFFSGLYEIIPVDLLSIFNPPELQILISGSQTTIDIDDLQSNTTYAGGYHRLDVTIIRFWKVVRAMSFEEQSLLLRFVTACPRPPSLGFSSLTPRFTIQRIDNDASNQRLPSASTCFNILKLPTYPSETILKEKIIYAITSKSGFDLS